MERNSSNSALTPLAITPPLLSIEGVSLLISLSIRSRISWQVFNCSPMRQRVGSLLASQTCLIASTARSATFSCTTSRGVTRPTATFEIIRSKSPICSNCVSNTSFISGSRKKYSTTSSLSSIGLTSFRGNKTQRRSIREPIGDIVLSITFKRLVPSSFIGETNSRLRTVNLSKRTYRSSSMRVSEMICWICVCSVISK